MSTTVVIHPTSTEPIAIIITIKSETPTDWWIAIPEVVLAVCAVLTLLISCAEKYRKLRREGKEATAADAEAGTKADRRTVKTHHADASATSSWAEGLRERRPAGRGSRGNAQASGFSIG